MLKLFIITLLFIFNLNILAQVVIKDEIILYEKENPDEETLTMPFYGKVEGTVPWGSVFWNYFKRVEIEAGGQTVARGCPCNGCGVFNGNWVINNLTAATPVVVRAYTHCFNGDFVEGETRLINTGENEYEIEVYNPDYQLWFEATTLKFIATIPITCTEPCDDCPELPECEYYEDYPPFTFKRKVEGVNNTVACTSSVCPSDPQQEGQLAGFIPISDWDLLDEYTWNLYLCSDPATGNVNFRYSVDYQGQTIDSIPIPYIIAHCDDSGCDPPKIHIEHIVDLVDKLNNNEILSNEYCELEDDICNFWGSSPIPNYRFLLRELTDAHEDVHFTDYKKKLTELKSEYLDNLIKNISYPCATYQNNPSEIEEDAQNRIGNTIKAFIAQAIHEFNELPNKDLDIQQSKEIGELAYKYHSKFVSWLLINDIKIHDICALPSSCSKLIKFINN